MALQFQTRLQTRHLTAIVMCVSALFTLGNSGRAADDAVSVVGELQIHPAAITLSHRQRPHSALLTGSSADGLSLELSSQAEWKSSNEAVATVDLFGWIHPVANGDATITATAYGKTASVPVTVKLDEQPRPYSFRHDVM
ncbi:MAG: Ig-like domain-containing protein, partial [Rhodopirellula sp.]|nr:Ig-like domain-containing protein [Rhodopirellula sp.]